MTQKLTGQNWLHWTQMAEHTLAGASQMVWQSPDERKANRELFAKVMGASPMPEVMWNRSLTWTGATLLALATEQGLKSLALRVTSECLKTHDLERLWDEIRPEDQRGIVQAARWVKKRTQGTRLGQAVAPTSPDECREIIHVHRTTFEHARYFMETRHGRTRGHLTKNLELWMLALAVLRHARTLP